MISWLDTALGILEKRGPMEVNALVDAALRVKHVAEPRRQLALRIFGLAEQNQRGLAIVERPKYRLKTAKRPDRLHYYIVQNTAYKVLSLCKGRALNANELTEQARAAGLSFEFDEFTTYRALRDARFSKLFAVVGRLALAVRPTEQARPAGPDDASLGQNVHEVHLEAFLAEHLGIVERGLALIKRQYSVPPVGRIDLFCRDGKGNLVVIEIKRLAANTDAVVQQITAYMSWVREHVARPGQLVRGIIIGGEPNHTLAYAIKAVPNLCMKCFKMDLRDYDPGEGYSR